MAAYTYPNPPQGVPESVIRPSARFKKEVSKIIAALAVFSLLYFVMLLASLVIAVSCVMIAYLLLTSVHNVLAIAMGVGLLGMGLMVLFFVTKFLFAKKKTNQSGYVEILEMEYPDLFAFIRRISEETGTVFPKHIYVSSEVNAAVFYDSSFWSMIFPVRKNLVIGLGLINMTNLSEFKAVIAHEFGHFSQKSMRAGSYVYQANKVIYNMLYENTGYNTALQRFANVHYTFALCARLTVAIVQAIQWILQQAYKSINRQYMSLSRQMEFHADAVSARSAGSNNAIHALRRIDFADACYSSVITHYNEWIPLNLKGGNLYSQQRIAATFIAGELGLPFVAGLPVMHEADQHYKSFNRVSIGSQWDSHPTRQQREEAMNQLNINGVVIEESAWALFPDAHMLQEQITNGVYEAVRFSDEPVLIDDGQFAAKYEAARREYSFPAVYEGYYNRRTISRFDPELPAPGRISFDNISDFFKTHKDTQAKLEAAREDVQLLEQIADKTNGIRSFDFEGNKYGRSDAGLVKATLEAEINGLADALTANDHQVYEYFMADAGWDSPEAEGLKKRYKNFFELQQIGSDNIDACNHMLGLIRPFYAEQTIERAREMNLDLQDETRAFTHRISKMDGILKASALMHNNSLPESLNDFGKKDWCFLNASDEFLSEELETLEKYVEQFGDWAFEMNFHSQKALLQFQAVMMPVGELV